MPRIRTLKPEALQHRKVGKLTDRQFRLWVGMITQADDDGRLVAEPEQIRVQFFAYHTRVKTTEIATALEAIADVGLIGLYSANNVRYAYFPSWVDHQRIHSCHYTPSRLPAPRQSGTAPGQVPNRYGTDTAGSDRKGKDQDRKGSATPAQDGTDHRLDPLPVFETTSSSAPAGAGTRHPDHPEDPASEDTSAVMVLSQAASSGRTTGHQPPKHPALPADGSGSAKRAEAAKSKANDTLRRLIQNHCDLFQAKFGQPLARRGRRTAQTSSGFWICMGPKWLSNCSACSLIPPADGGSRRRPM